MFRWEKIRMGYSMHLPFVVGLLMDEGHILRTLRMWLSFLINKFLWPTRGPADAVGGYLRARSTLRPIQGTSRKEHFHLGIDFRPPT